MVCQADVQYAEITLNQEALLKSKHEQPKAVVHKDSETVLVNLTQEADHTAKTQAAQDKYAENEAAKKSFWLLAYCFLGIMVSFTLNGLVLEKITTHRVLGEMSLTFVFCLFYSVVALVLRVINKEKPSTMPQSKLMIVGLLAFGSTISSMVALRYVTFITRVLGKSCKSIPVMVMGVFLGKRYALKKYVSVVVLSIGVALFLVGTAHEKHHRAVQHNDENDHHVATHERTPNMFLGTMLLFVSLLLDGATGALEDRFLEKYHIGAFDLMFVVNIWKSLFAAIGMVFMGEVPVFVEQIMPSLPNVFLLSATGALGQAFIFYTISKFGALTTSIIGTCRKVLSIVLSVILFGHILSWEQFIGLSVAFLGIGLNWVRMECFSKKKDNKEHVEKDLEAMDLLESGHDTTDSSEEDELSPEHREALLTLQAPEEVMQSRDVERGLELVNVWHRQHEHVHEHEEASSTDDTAHDV